MSMALRQVLSGVILSVGLIFMSPASAGKPSGSAYLDGKESKIGVILCHGRGHHPTSKVVDPLRKGIHDQLGYHTLSLQMPGDKKKDWKKFVEDFPRAYQEIEAGIAFLRDEKKVERIYIMGHSMGSRMATAYLSENPNAPVAGFIGVGVRNGGGEPLDSDLNLRRVKIPVVDIYGDGGDGKDLSDAQERASMVSARYKQVLLPGADHQFDSHEKEMVKAVVDWLREIEAGSR